MDVLPLPKALTDQLEELTRRGIHERPCPNANCRDRFIATRDRPDKSCPIRVLPDVDLVNMYAGPLQRGTKPPAEGTARPPEERHR